jgi:hypothetical protein
MSKAFDDMKKLHDKARDAHMFNSQLETESVPNEFIAYAALGFYFPHSLIILKNR